MYESESCSVVSNSCNPVDYTVHRILQARILEWVAIPFYMGSSQPRDQTQVSHTAGRFFTSWATREAHQKAWLSQMQWLTHILMKFPVKYIPTLRAWISAALAIAGSVSRLYHFSPKLHYSFLSPRP